MKTGANAYIMTKHTVPAKPGALNQTSPHVPLTDSNGRVLVNNCRRWRTGMGLNPVPTTNYPAISSGWNLKPAASVE